MAKYRFQTLSYAVRGSVILKYFGQVCRVLAVFATVPLTVALIVSEYDLAVPHAVVVTLFVAVSIALSRIKAPSNIQPNEALVITALLFLFWSLTVSLPMAASGLSFSSALFEAVSAVTTTGLTTLDSVEYLPRSFLFSRAWAQWSGGLGIVVFTVALLFRPGMEAKRLAGIEESADLVAGTRFYALHVIRVYGIITVTGVVLLLLTGVDFFPAILHALSGVSTGGFSSYDRSLASMSGWPPRAAATFLGITGAVSLSLYHQTFRRGWRTITENADVRVLFVSGAVVSIVLAGLWYGEGMPLGEIVRRAPLLAFSAQTTTGFSPLPPAGLDSASKVVLILSMLTGGCIGSTAGGIKTFRILVLFTMIRMLLDRTRMPEHAIAEVRIGGRRVGDDEIENALLVALLFIVVTALSWIPFVVMGYGALDSLFEVASATATTGLSAGITGPNLPGLLRLVLGADMLMGRLEIVAVLVLFYPGTWRGKRTATS
jgi:trk system potassium uptake protein TrkH